MKRHTTLSSVAIGGIIVAVAVVYGYNYAHRQELYQAQREKMFTQIQEADDASDAFRKHIVIRSQQLEKSGVGGNQFDKALGLEERQAQNELNHQLHQSGHS